MAQPNSFDIPFRDQVVGPSLLCSDVWSRFFQGIYDRLYPLGIERAFPLENNQATAANIDGLSFTSKATSQAEVEFLVQRITTGDGATELVESGSFILVFKPTSNTWAIALTNINTPDNSGVDFTVTATGQVQYTSTSITGTASISRVLWRAKTIAGKSSLYSSQAAR